MLSGLAALARGGEPESAIDQLRAVVEQDSQWAYSSAKLLVLVLYRALGDTSSLSVVVDACMADDKPDRFAQRAVAECSLLVSRFRDDSEPLRLDHMLRFPALATQLATAGAQLIGENIADGCAALASAIDLTETPWQPRFDGEPPSDVSIAQRSLVQELSSTLCFLYLAIGEPDSALELLAQVLGRCLLEGDALRDKGLTDAALVAYDNADKDGEKRGRAYQFHARYEKAKLLISLSNFTRARKELARLYADEPSYADEDRLLDAIKPRTQSSSRTPIPESVRHAVWRRDDGRCVHVAVRRV